MGFKRITQQVEPPTPAPVWFPREREKNKIKNKKGKKKRKEKFSELLIVSLALTGCFRFLFEFLCLSSEQINFMEGLVVGSSQITRIHIQCKKSGLSIRFARAFSLRFERRSHFRINNDSKTFGSIVASVQPLETSTPSRYNNTQPSKSNHSTDFNFRDSYFHPLVFGHFFFFQ